MTTEEYDQLLEDIQTAREAHREALDRVLTTESKLYRLLRTLDQEDSRIAQSALSQSHSASRKLVVGE